MKFGYVVLLLCLAFSSQAFALSAANDTDDLDSAPLRVSMLADIPLSGKSDSFLQGGRLYRSTSDFGFQEHDPYCKVTSGAKKLAAKKAFYLKGEFVEGTCGRTPGACHIVYRLKPLANGPVESIECTGHEGNVKELKESLGETKVAVDKLSPADVTAKLWEQTDQELKKTEKVMDQAGNGTDYGYGAANLIQNWKEERDSKRETKPIGSGPGFSSEISTHPSAESGKR